MVGAMGELNTKGAGSDGAWQGEDSDSWQGSLVPWESYLSLSRHLAGALDKYTVQNIFDEEVDT